MNSRQLQYAVVLSEILNISQAAEKLNITQPALSKQILALEKELGVVLFDRSSTPLVLTRAGERFVKEAEEILFKEKQLKFSMEDFKTGDKGRLTIGISPFRASYFISDIIKQLQKKYEGLQIVLNEENSTQLHKDAIDGKLDFALINLPVDEALLDVTVLEPEPIVLVVPNNLLYVIPGDKEKKEIDFADCSKLPFIALRENQELRQLFDKICLTSEFVPNITVEAVGIATAWNLAKAGIGASVLPLKFVEESHSSKDVSVFSIKNSANVRKPAIVRRKGQYLSKYANDAIDLIISKTRNA